HDREPLHLEAGAVDRGAHSARTGTHDEARAAAADRGTPSSGRRAAGGRRPVVAGVGAAPVADAGPWSMGGPRRPVRAAVGARADDGRSALPGLGDDAEHGDRYVGIDGYEPVPSRITRP